MSIGNHLSVVAARGQQWKRVRAMRTQPLEYRPTQGNRSSTRPICTESRQHLDPKYPLHYALNQIVDSAQRRIARRAKGKSVKSVEYMGVV